jgi:ribosomal-protein-alanine N-acetyltransferase
VRYRPYASEDFVQLYGIEAACFEPPFRFGRRYMRSLVDRRHGATWIAEEGGHMAGFAIVEWAQEIGGIVAYLQTIEVLPSDRGYGAGGELLRLCEESARAAGAALIWLHVDETNAKAIRLYEAHGYQKQGGEEDYYSPGRGALIYRKLLDFGGELK